MRIEEKMSFEYNYTNIIKDKNIDEVINEGENRCKDRCNMQRKK